MSYSAISTTPNKEITRKARASLKGNWGLSIIGLFLLGAIGFFIAIIGIFIPGLVFLTMGAFSTGVCCFYLRVIRSQESELEDLFQGFKIFWLTARTCFSQLLILGGFLLLLLIPIFFLLAFLPNSHHHMENIHYTSLDYIILTITTLIIFALYIVVIMASLSLSMTFYALSDHPLGTALESLNHSNKLMKGHKWKLFCLFFRFIGWWVLCIFTLGIGFLWLAPYILSSHAAFYDDIKQLREPKASPV
jgi:uncharacterized membrane protein